MQDNMLYLTCASDNEGAHMPSLVQSMYLRRWSVISRGFLRVWWTCSCTLSMSWVFFWKHWLGVCDVLARMVTPSCCACENYAQTEKILQKEFCVENKIQASGSLCVLWHIWVTVKIVISSGWMLMSLTSKDASGGRRVSKASAVFAYVWWYGCHDDLHVSVI